MLGFLAYIVCEVKRQRCGPGRACREHRSHSALPQRECCAPRQSRGYRDLLVMVVSIAAMGAATACDRRDPALPDIERQPRVINSPPQGVRALPPHAIRGDGVGPYRLGIPLEQLGNQVPSGAQNAQVDIPRVVHLSVLRAEDDAILVGAADPGARASFVAIVRGEIARTITGIHVGSGAEELARALGDRATDLVRARDPRIFMPEHMRELRAFLAESHRIAGIVVASPEPPARPSAGCTRPTLTPAAHSSETPVRSVPVDASNTPADSNVRVALSDQGSGAAPARYSAHAGDPIGACIAGAIDVALVADPDLAVRFLDADKTIRLPKVANWVWAAPVRNAEGWDDVVVVARSEDEQVRTWFLSVFRFENPSAGARSSAATRTKPEPGLRVLKLVDAMPVYQLTAANARWLGCELADVDLALEVTSRTDSWEIGGLLVTRRGDAVRDLYVLSPSQVPLRAGIAGGHTTGVETHPKVISR